MLRATIGAVVGVLGIREIAQAGDAWVQMSAKLQLVSRSAGEAAAIQEQLFRIAQRSRTEVGATVDFYFKLANASKELGVSQQQTIQITDTLNKLLKVGGVDTVRAAQVTYQLSQSFTKQRLAWGRA